MSTSLDVAIVQALLIYCVGLLFSFALRAFGEYDMSRVMRMTTYLLIVMVIVVPIVDLGQRAAAWVSGMVDRFEAFGDKVTGVTEKVEDVTEGVENATKDPKKFLWEKLKEQLKDPE